MARIYTEIRIAHKTEQDRTDFKQRLSSKADQLGMTVSEYVRFVALHAEVSVKADIVEDKPDE